MKSKPILLRTWNILQRKLAPTTILADEWLEAKWCGLLLYAFSFISCSLCYSRTTQQTGSSCWSFLVLSVSYALNLLRLLLSHALVLLESKNLVLAIKHLKVPWPVSTAHSQIRATYEILGIIFTPSVLTLDVNTFNHPLLAVVSVRLVRRHIASSCQTFKLPFLSSK